MSRSTGIVDGMAPAKTKTNPLGSGRNPRKGEASSNVTIRLAPVELDTYRAAAVAADLTLGEWIRAACEAWLKRSTKKGR